MNGEPRNDPAALERGIAGPRHFRLGRLGIRLSGASPILPHLHAELDPLRVDELEPHVDVQFVSALPPLREAVVLSPLLVSAEAYHAAHAGLEYVVSGNAPRLRVQVRASKRFSGERLAPEWLWRVGNRTHLLPSELVAKNFMYNVFDHLTQLANLQLGQSYLHASSFERDGQGIAMAAWGGVGKTTTMLKLVSERGWRFLSDDLALVDVDGRVWRTPKRLQVYGYNVEGQPGLRETLMGRRSAMDRAAWRFRRATGGTKRVRRRVSAEDLFGPARVATSAKLTRVFAMERADVPALVLEPIAPEELVRRATATLMREVQPLGDLISALYSGGHHPVLPTYQEFLERTAATLTRAFAGLPVALVRVPLATKPDELADFVVRALDAD